MSVENGWAVLFSLPCLPSSKTSNPEWVQRRRGGSRVTWLESAQPPSAWALCGPVLPDSMVSVDQTETRRRPSRENDWHRVGCSLSSSPQELFADWTNNNEKQARSGFHMTSSRHMANLRRARPPLASGFLRLLRCWFLPSFKCLEKEPRAFQGDCDFPGRDPWPGCGVVTGEGSSICTDRVQPRRSYVSVRA